jgi:hypothetical protein
VRTDLAALCPRHRRAFNDRDFDVVAESDDTIVTEIDLVNGDPAGGQLRQRATTWEIFRVREGRIVSCRSHYMPEPADGADAVRVPAHGEASVVAEEQAALRWVATLVARGIAQEELFVALAAEVGRLPGYDITFLNRYTTLTARSRWSADGIAPATRCRFPSAAG